MIGFFPTLRKNVPPARGPEVTATMNVRAEIDAESVAGIEKMLRSYESVLARSERAAWMQVGKAWRDEIFRLVPRERKPEAGLIWGLPFRVDPNMAANELRILDSDGNLVGRFVLEGDGNAT